MPDAFQRILVSRVGRVGDMVMVTPALRAILRKHPRAEIHVLTSPDGRRVLEGFDERIGRLIVYRRKGLGQQLRRRRVRREIARHDYDGVYCFDERETMHDLLSRVGRRRFMLPLGKHGDVPYPRDCLRLVANDADVDEQWVSLPVLPGARERARSMLAQRGIVDDDFVIGLHPSFASLRKMRLRRGDYTQRKEWPVGAWAELGRRLAERRRWAGRRIVVVADLMPEDRELGESVAVASGGRVEIFTEPPDFELYKATLERFDLLVTPDTGPMHVAAAVGTNLVALFAVHDPIRYGPYTDPRRYSVVKATDHGAASRGLKALEPGVVLDVVLEQLSKG